MATFVEGKCCALSCTASSFWKKQHQLYLYMLSLCMGVCRPWRGDSNYWNVSTQSNTACLYAFSFLACNPILLHPAAVTRQNGSIKSLFVTRSAKISKFSLKCPSGKHSFWMAALLSRARVSCAPGGANAHRYLAVPTITLLNMQLIFKFYPPSLSPPKKPEIYITNDCHKFTASNMFTI